MAQFVLRWRLDDKAFTTVIPGATKAAQARENPAASGLAPLSAELHERLRALYQVRVAEYIRGAV